MDVGALLVFPISEYHFDDYSCVRIWQCCALDKRGLSTCRTGGARSYAHTH
jgi:hypothetical protein